MNKSGRLRKKSEFRNVYNKGKVYTNALLVMYIVKNDTDNNRAGFSVSKKVGNSVTRNKVRRRIKECYRLNSMNIKKGYNIVFISRVRTKDVKYKDIEKAMISLFKKADILAE